MPKHCLQCNKKIDRDLSQASIPATTKYDEIPEMISRAVGKDGGTLKIVTTGNHFEKLSKAAGESGTVTVRFWTGSYKANHNHFCSVGCAAFYGQEKADQADEIVLEVECATQEPEAEGTEVATEESVAA